MADRARRLLPLLRILRGRERERAVEATRRAADHERTVRAHARADADNRKSERSLREALFEMEKDMEQTSRARVRRDASQDDLERWSRRAHAVELALEAARRELTEDTTARRRMERAIDRWRTADAAERLRRERLQADDDATRRRGEAA